MARQTSPEPEPAAAAAESGGGAAVPDAVDPGRPTDAEAVDHDAGPAAPDAADPGRPTGAAASTGASDAEPQTEGDPDTGASDAEPETEGDPDTGASDAEPETDGADTGASDAELETEGDPDTGASEGEAADADGHGKGEGQGESEAGGAEPAEIDPEILARRREALRHVRKLGDPVLRARAVEVDSFDDRLREEVARMGMLMEDAMGVGLAATQLGILHRLLVYRVQQESPVIALVNPEIEWSGDELETMEEGCLSLPGVHVDVERAIRLRVRARDEHGEAVTVEASGLEARVIAHEVDHLDGILILDRTSREQRRDAMRAIREAANAAASVSASGSGP